MRPVHTDIVWADVVPPIPEQKKSQESEHVNISFFAQKEDALYSVLQGCIDRAEVTVYDMTAYALDAEDDEKWSTQT